MPPKGTIETTPIIELGYDMSIFIEVGFGMGMASIKMVNPWSFILRTPNKNPPDHHGFFWDRRNHQQAKHQQPWNPGSFSFWRKGWFGTQTMEQSVICWRLLHSRRLSNHWNYYFTTVYTCNLYHISLQTIYIYNTIQHVPSVHFVDLNIFSNIFSPHKSRLLGRSSPSYVRIHHNQGRPVLPRILTRIILQGWFKRPASWGANFWRIYIIMRYTIQLHIIFVQAFLIHSNIYWLYTICIQHIQHTIFFLLYQT